MAQDKKPGNLIDGSSRQGIEEDQKFPEAEAEEMFADPEVRQDYDHFLDGIDDEELEEDLNKIFGKVENNEPSAETSKKVNASANSD